MTIVEWFEVLGSLATLITGLFTLGTLIEMKNEREISKRPELLIRNHEKIILYDEGYFIARSWINEEDYRQKNSGKRFAYLIIENIGLGVAKDIKVDWEYELDKTLKNILKTDKNFSVNKQDDMTLLEYKLDFDEVPQAVVIGFGPETQIIEYLSPNRDNIYSCKIEIPHQYEGIFSAQTFIYADKMDYCNNDVCAPKLICYLSYQNIYGKKYKKKYEIEFKLYNAISNNAEIIDGEIFGDQTNVAGVDAEVKLAKFSR